MRNLKKYWWIAVIIIALPFAFLICDTTNEAKTWVPFFGAYIGAVIAASISFLILYRTIEANRREAEIKRQEDKLIRLKDHLASINGIIDFALLGSINPTLTINGVNGAKNEIALYNSYCRELRVNYYQHSIKYYNENKDFTDRYRTYTDFILDKINNLISLIMDTEGDSLANIIEKIDIIKSEMGSKKEDIKILGSLALQWIEREQKKLDELKK